MLFWSDIHQEGLKRIDIFHFHLSGHVNKQDLLFWDSEQPHEHAQPSFSQEKVTVWCAIGCNGIVGPYWFVDTDGRCVTVDTDRYIALMRTKFIPALRRQRDVAMNTVIFQQDGAASHCSNMTSQATASSHGAQTFYGHRTHLV